MRPAKEVRDQGDGVWGVRHGNPVGTRISSHGRRVGLRIPPDLLDPKAGTMTLEEYQAWLDEGAS